MNSKTLLTPLDSLPRWLGEHALVGLRAKFRCPDYQFELEPTQHVQNVTCSRQNVLVKVVCFTNFEPPAALVDAWRGVITLK